MKIEELLKEVASNEDLKKEITAAVKDGKITDFLKKMGCEASAEDIKKLLSDKIDLSDDQLKAVAGGLSNIISGLHK